MSKISISNLEKNKIKNVLISFKGYFSGDDIRRELFNADINLEVPTNYIQGYNLYYKKDAIKFIFDNIEDDDVLSYISKIYLNILKTDEFLEEINKCLIQKNIKLNDDGFFTSLDENFIEYEDKLISDLFDKFGLEDIKERLEKAKEFLNNAIIEDDEIYSTISAQQSGIALEGVLKFIYFHIMNNTQSTPINDLDGAINYYLDKLASIKIGFLERKDALFKIIDAIRSEFRNIGSHYNVDDIKKFDSVRVEISSALLCLWSSKAVILCLLKKYEEEFNSF